MSNEYKDWFRDAMQDEVLEQGLVDVIAALYPENDPCFIVGLKNHKRVVYYVNLTPEGWLCRKEEIQPFDFN